MGRRGPAPKPTQLRIVEGNPSKRAINRAEPMPRLRIPACPRWLRPLARNEWHRVAPKLARLRLLSEIDGNALAAYCEAVVLLREAEAVLAEKGLTYTTGGIIRSRPEVQVAQRSLMLIRHYSAEFGLTPSARSRIALQEEPTAPPQVGILS